MPAPCASSGRTAWARNCCAQQALRPGSLQAHAFTHLDFAAASRRYGKVGGFAHLATLVKRLKASRPGALLLDGGDSWQGSATSLWTQAADMVQAQLALGVDATTGHWEFTYGMERVKQIVDHDFKGRIAFLAQNVKTADFGDPVFEPFVLREVNGVPVAVIGQAYPYTPIANPRYWVADWTFGIQDERLQGVVDQVRAKRRAGGRRAVAQRHGRRSEDGLARARHRRHLRRPHARRRAGGGAGAPMRGGQTLVTNAGSNGKFLGVMDLRVAGGPRRRLSLPAAAGVLRTCCRPTRRWTR